MTRAEFATRTKKFALAVIEAVESLPKTKASDVVGNQLLRSATSVAANYRASCRARSRREFMAKMGIVEEEADESQFWIAMLVGRGLIEKSKGPQFAIRNPQCSF